MGSSVSPSILSPDSGVRPDSNAASLQYDIVSESSASHSRFAIEYADSVDSNWDWTFQLPWNYRPQMRARIFWYSPTATSGNARFVFNTAACGGGDNSATKSLTAGTAFTSAVDTGADRLSVSGWEDVPASAAALGGDFFLLRLEREASNAGDTVNDLIRVLFVQLEIAVW